MSINNSHLKAAIFCLGDETFIARYRKNMALLKELGFQVQSFTLKPKICHNAKAIDGVLIDGWSRRLRGRFFAPIRQFEITIRFFWAILKYKPDILFAHNLPSLIVGGIIIRILGRKKRVFIYDAMELESARVSLVRAFIPFMPRDFQRVRLERFFVKSVDIVTSADYARTEVMSKRLARPDILTCRNIPKLSQVHRMRLFKDKIKLREDAFIFLYQGIISKGRGIEQGIRILKNLPEQIVFVIMGMGYDEIYAKTLKLLAEEVGVSERVFILPPVSYAELLKWTSSADVVHSLIENVCLSYYLAAPNKLYEAAMVGVPVIASRFPEMESVLTRHPYGILVDPSSIEEITEALLYLYKNKSVRDEFSKAAIMASRTELNWESESQNLRNKICEIVCKLENK